MKYVEAIQMRKQATASAVPEFTVSSDPADTEWQKRLIDSYRMLQNRFKDTTYYRATGDKGVFDAAALLAMARYAQERWPKARSNMRFGFSSTGAPWGVANMNKGQEGELLWDIQKTEKNPSYIFSIADEASGLDMLKAKSPSKTYTEALAAALKGVKA